MTINLTDLRAAQNNASPEEKRALLNEMAATLPSTELSAVIEFMQEPYLKQRLQDYLMEEQLPASDSPELAFLLLAEKYHGNLARKMMTAAAISNYSQNKFIKKYQLREIAPGYYVFPNKGIDGAFLFQLQYANAVISHDSALFYHGLSDVIPRSTTMSMPETYKITQIHSEKTVNPLRQTTIISRRTADLISEDETPYVLPRKRKDGAAVVVTYEENDPIIVIRNNDIPTDQIIEKATIYHNPVRVTTMERSLVDVLRPGGTTEEEVKEIALKRYFELAAAKPVRLRRIADEQHVGETLAEYLWKLKLD